MENDFQHGQITGSEHFLEHKAGIATSPVERENIKKEDMVK
jgi:hypothetical protein